MISLKNAVFPSIFTFSKNYSSLLHCISRLICSYLVFACLEKYRKNGEKNLWESAFWNSYFCLKMVVLLSVLSALKITHNTQCTSSLKLFEKSKFCPKIQFWQNPNIFTSFSPKFFFTIFLVKSKLSTAQKSKTTTFSRFFFPKKSTIFSGHQIRIFGQNMKISNSVRILTLIEPFK